MNSELDRAILDTVAHSIAPKSQQSPIQTINPLTEEDVRRIFREELKKCYVIVTDHWGSSFKHPIDQR